MENITEEKKLEQSDDIREYVRFRIKAKTLKEILGFKNAIDCISIVKLVFTEDGIEYAVTNETHDVMIKTSIKKELCNEYSLINNIKTSNKVILDIDMENVLTFLKISTKEDSILFVYDSNADSSHFSMSIGNVTRRFGICSDSEVSEIKTPKLELPASFTIRVEDLKKFLTQSGEITYQFSITTTSDDVKLFAENDTEKVDFPVTVQNLVSNSTHKSLFSIELFEGIVKKFMSLFDTVDVGLGTDNPVQLTGSKMKKTGSPFLNVVVLIAPRIESE